MILGDKIIIQERGGGHTILFLLDGPYIEDRIDFDEVRHSQALGVNRRSGPNYEEYDWGRHPDVNRFEGEEADVSETWKGVKETSVLLDAAGLPWQKAPDYFNCCSGVVGCLWKVGLTYIDPVGRPDREGAKPNFLKYGINISEPAVK